MAEPWIRVHANLAAKPVVVRAVESLGISQNEAIGVLVRFWGAVSQHVTDGVVGHFSDVQLEVWAGWTRKKGKFAAFIRAAHLDSDGRVNEWDEYAGALEEQRRKSRERKRKSRGSHRGSHAEVCEPPHLRDDTIRDDIEQRLLPQNAAEAEAEAGLAAMLDSDADRNALTVVVSRASNRLACLTALTSMLTGNDTAVPRPRPAVFGQALRDMATNNAQPTARKIRNYIADAARAMEETRRPPLGEAVRPGTGARTYATALDAIRDIES